MRLRYDASPNRVFGPIGGPKRCGSHSRSPLAERFAGAIASRVIGLVGYWKYRKTAKTNCISLEILQDLRFILMVGTLIRWNGEP